MTVARSKIIDLESTQYYHCMMRCVRKGYLCGVNRETGVDYSHRKQWIVERLHELDFCFAIKICAYAIMDNHYHLVLHVNESQAFNWTDKEVMSRWRLLHPNNYNDHAQTLESINTHDAQTILKEWRSRLMSISWYMKELNEYIARRANKEEECTGRFWNGRYKSQPLLDFSSVLSAMVYVDLNPVRAKVANTLEESNFTSISERLRTLAKGKGASHRNALLNNDYELLNNQPRFLMRFEPLKKNNKDCIHSVLDFSLYDYITLVEQTGKSIRADKRGSLQQNSTSIVQKLQLNPNEWVNMILTYSDNFSPKGAEIYLLDFASRKQRKVNGVKAAKRFYT